MTNKAKIIGSAVLAVLLFLAGRFSAPARVEIRKEREVTDSAQKALTQSQAQDIARDKDVKRTVTETVFPDGRRVTKTSTHVRSKTEKHKAAEMASTETWAHQEKETETKIVQSRQTIQIAGLVGFDFSARSPVYGASVSTQVLGPISLGAWALTNRTLGLSVGLGL